MIRPGVAPDKAVAFCRNYIGRAVTVRWRGNRANGIIRPVLLQVTMRGLVGVDAQNISAFPIDAFVLLAFIGVFPAAISSFCLWFGYAGTERYILPGAVLPESTLLTSRQEESSCKKQDTTQSCKFPD